MTGRSPEKNVSEAIAARIASPTKATPIGLRCEIGFMTCTSLP
jgi:hypothetical protein